MKEHCLEKRIYYHDTDTGGVVYYANYLKHLEEGRTEFLRSHGVDVGEYTAKGILFPVVHLEVDYKSPARYGDIIQIYSKLEKLGNASATFSQEVKRGQTLLLKAQVTWACVDGSMKAKRIPEEIRVKIQ